MEDQGYRTLLEDSGFERDDGTTNIAFQREEEVFTYQGLYRDPGEYESLMAMNEVAREQLLSERHTRLDKRKRNRELITLYQQQSAASAATRKHISPSRRKRRKEKSTVVCRADSDEEAHKHGSSDADPNSVVEEICDDKEMRELPSLADMDACRFSRDLIMKILYTPKWKEALRGALIRFNWGMLERQDQQGMEEVYRIHRVIGM